MIHIISIVPLEEFCVAHAQYQDGIRAWITIVKSCDWKKPQDIVDTFGANAIDLLGKKNNKPTTASSNRVVFDIKGNNIRIIAKYVFHENLKESRLYIKWIGTHAEYTKLCNNGSQYDVSMFN